MLVGLYRKSLISYVYMRHLFDNENHEMSEVYRKVRRPVFIDGNKDNDVQDL